MSANAGGGQTITPEDAAIRARDIEIRRLEDSKRTLETKISSLKTRLEKLKGIIANTLYGTKKVLQTAMVFLAWRWFGFWVAAGLFCALLLTEIIERGYKKVLELGPESFGWD